MHPEDIFSIWNIYFKKFFWIDIALRTKCRYITLTEQEKLFRKVYQKQTTNETNWKNEAFKKRGNQLPIYVYKVKY